MGAVAVENDYHLLALKFYELADAITDLRNDVQGRRLREAEERREPNETNWVDLIGARLLKLEHNVKALEAGAVRILESEPGAPVFAAQPVSAPDHPPETKTGSSPLV